MIKAHDRYNRLFRQTHKTFQIHHLALLMVNDYILILLGTLQRIHRQYVRYESALDDTLIGIEQIIQETELIVLTENNYIPLTQAQISLCAKIGYMYYCEYAHLLKKCMEHTCLSAIYYDQGSDIKVKQCKTIVTFDTILESKILEASVLLILSNLQKPWTIACKDISRVFEIKYSTYCILNRS